MTAEEEEKSGWNSSNQDMEDNHGDDDDEEKDEGFTAMRSGSSEASFVCSLTCQTLRQPVTLPCQHSFSKAALEAFLENEDGREGGGAGGQGADEQQENSFEKMRRCPNAACRQIIPSGALSINRALDENIARYFPKDEVHVADSLISPGTKNAVAKTVVEIDPMEALEVSEL